MASNPSEHIFTNTTVTSTGLNTNANENIDKLEMPDSLYAYSIGIKELEAKSIQYSEKQVYITKPLEVTGNVMEIQLETKEEHPIFDELDGEALRQQTSIEYYIAYKEQPNLNDWIAILPLGQEEVDGERLLPDNVGYATLRFKAIISSIRVYANGLRLKDGTYVINGEDNIRLRNYNPSVIYTVSYTPNAFRQDPWTFKLSDYKKDVKKVTETFTSGTAYNKSISLSNAPFIDLSRIREEENYNPNTSEYKPIQVTLKNADIQGPGNTTVKEIQPYKPELQNVPYTYNKTLYEDKSWSVMSNYNLREDEKYLGFDYYHYGDKLVFTEHFNVPKIPQNRHHTHGNADIEVTYDILISQFRLKAVLRRNTPLHRTATPKLQNYKLLFKTIK